MRCTLDEMHTLEMHAMEMYALEMSLSVRCTLGETHAH